MVGEDYKTDMDAAWTLYSSKDTVNNDSTNLPANEAAKAAGSGLKSFMHDFGLEKSMNPETVLKIYGDN